MHRTSAYSSSPTGALGADWDQPTRDARSVRTQGTGRASKAGLSKVNSNTEDRTLHTYRTVPTGHVRRVPCNLPGMSEPKQCYGRRSFTLQYYGRHQFPYQANAVIFSTCLWASTVLWAPSFAIHDEYGKISHMRLTQ